jgi:hypothetical protein
MANGLSDLGDKPVPSTELATIPQITQAGPLPPIGQVGKTMFGKAVDYVQKKAEQVDEAVKAVVGTAKEKLEMAAAAESQGNPNRDEMTFMMNFLMKEQESLNKEKESLAKKEEYLGKLQKEILEGLKAQQEELAATTEMIKSNIEEARRTRQSWSWWSWIRDAVLLITGIAAALAFRDALRLIQTQNQQIPQQSWSRPGIGATPTTSIPTLGLGR